MMSILLLIHFPLSLVIQSGFHQYNLWGYSICQLFSPHRVSLSKTLHFHLHTLSFSISIPPLSPYLSPSLPPPPLSLSLSLYHYEHFVCKCFMLILSILFSSYLLMSDEFNVRDLNFQISSPTFLKQYFGYDIILFSSIGCFLHFYELFMCITVVSLFVWDGHRPIYFLQWSRHLHWLSTRLERGSSVGRMPDSQSREPGFESPLLPFRSLGIFFHFTTPQSTQLYKWVPGYRRWWKIVVAQLLHG